MLNKLFFFIILTIISCSTTVNDKNDTITENSCLSSDAYPDVVHCTLMTHRAQFQECYQSSSPTKVTLDFTVDETGKATLSSQVNSCMFNYFNGILFPLPPDEKSFTVEETLSL